MPTTLPRRLPPLIAAGLFLGILYGTLAPRPADARTGYPRIFGWYLSGTLSQDEIPLIAKYDVLVLDADFPYDNPGELDQIRALNPDIKILAFIASNGTGAAAYERPPATVLHRHWQGIQDGDFWLYAVDGSHVEDWPGKWSANLTPNGPVNSLGENYETWFARFVDEAIWQTGQWDGVLLDDVWENISWLNGGLSSPIDSDRNGVADPSAQLDTWWESGEDALTQAVRARLGSSAIVMGNGPNHYYSALNGTIIENFPFNGYSSTLIPSAALWTKWMYASTTSYFTNLANFSAAPRQVAVINTYASGTKTEPDTTGRFQAHKRFTLGSTLLGDGYYSIDNDWRLHGSLWWQPEFDIHLGDPDGPAYSYSVGGLSIWRRDYAAASVVVNANPTALTAQAGLPNIGAWDAYIGPRIVDPPPPDVIPPANTEHYWGFDLGPNSGRLKWMAVGDDGLNGRASSYLIRHSLNKFFSEAEWAAATPIPNAIVPSYPGMWDSLDIGGLLPGTQHYFAVKAVDEAGNEAPLGPYYFRIITPDGPPPGDTTPPAAIVDLHVVWAETTSVFLAWTAPGDDGSSGTAALYEGRRSGAALTEANWAAATPLSGLPTPSTAGTAQSMTVTGLAPSTTYFVAIKSQDEVPNLSAMGNVVSFTTDTPPASQVDVTGPAPVADLAVAAAGETWLTLSFTAPADSQGTVKIYDLRYVSGASFDPSIWSTSPGAATESPQAPGATETVTVNGLVSGSTYSFRLRSVDNAGNPSALSNLATGTTPVPPDTSGPAPVGDLAVVDSTEHTLTVTFTAPADQRGTVTAYDLRILSGTSFPAGSWDAAGARPDRRPADAGRRGDRPGGRSLRGLGLRAPCPVGGRRRKLERPRESRHRTDGRLRGRRGPRPGPGSRRRGRRYLRGGLELVGTRRRRLLRPGRPLRRTLEFGAAERGHLAPGHPDCRGPRAARRRLPGDPADRGPSHRRGSVLRAHRHRRGGEPKPDQQRGRRPDRGARAPGHPASRGDPGASRRPGPQPRRSLLGSRPRAGHESLPALPGPGDRGDDAPGPLPRPPRPALDRRRPGDPRP